MSAPDCTTLLTYVHVSRVVVASVPLTDVVVPEVDLIIKGTPLLTLRHTLNEDGHVAFKIAGVPL